MTAVATRRGVTSFWIGIGAQGAHGVDLLGDFHGSEFAGDAGRVAAGHHQRGEHRTQLADQGDRNERAGAPHLAVLRPARGTSAGPSQRR